MDKLKPCPCCGSERVDTLKGNWMESEKPFWKVWCKSCQLRTWCEPTRKGAISVWNTRATDTDPALAAAEAELKEWRDMGVRAVTGGRGSGLELPMANEIWPNEWRQDVAIVAYLIHRHEARIAELLAREQKQAEQRKKQGLILDYAMRGLRHSAEHPDDGRMQAVRALAQHSEQQAGRIAELEEALEPFAQGYEYTKGTLCVTGSTVVPIPFGDLRRAAALLKENE